MKRILAGLGMVGVLLCTQARAISEYVPIQEKAQGHSLGGATLINDSLYSNPAGSGFTNIYSIEGTYGVNQSMAVSVVDTRTSSIGGGLGYFRTNLPYSDTQMQGVRVGLSTRASGSLALGASGKFVWGPGVDGESSRQNDVDLGALYNLGTVQLGYTVRNTFGGNVNFEQQREWIAGARFNYEDVVFFSASAIAPFSNFNPYQYGIGMEYVSPFYFALKGGYRFQPANGFSAWSLGGSMLAPKISFHYAIEFLPAGDRGTEHTLSAALNL